MIIEIYIYQLLHQGVWKGQVYYNIIGGESHGSFEPIGLGIAVMDINSAPWD